MVRYTTGDIFKSPAQVITNPVNCVGVMGGGLALEFKKRYADLFGDYVERCKKNLVKPGQPYLFETADTQILNFPTKRHWKDVSLIEDIESGLKFLAENYAEMGIFYLALPALGCGLGGLEWSDVKHLIDKHLGPVADLEVMVFEPAETGIKSGKRSTESRTPKSGSGVAAGPEL